MGTETFEAIDSSRKSIPTRISRKTARSIRRAASARACSKSRELLKADVGLEVAFLDSGGWDNHVNEGGAQGQLANLLRDLGQGIAAFHQDMGDRMDDIVVVDACPNSAAPRTKTATAAPITATPIACW